MSKSRNIPHVELYDEFGNLSMEALIAFAKGELNDTQKLEVQQAIDADEMYADALEGIMELEQPDDTRNAVYGINEKVRAQTGMQSSMSISPQVWRIAAGLALFITLSGSIIYVVTNTNFINNLASKDTASEKPLADNSANTKQEQEETYAEEPAMVMDSSISDEMEAIELGDNEAPLEEAPALVQKEQFKIVEDTKPNGKASGEDAVDRNNKALKAPEIKSETITATGGNGALLQEKSNNSVSLNGYLSQQDNKKGTGNRNVEMNNANVPAKADKNRDSEEQKKLEEELSKAKDKLAQIKQEEEAKMAAESASSKKEAERQAKEESKRREAVTSRAATAKSKQAETTENYDGFAYDAASDDMMDEASPAPAEYQQRDAAFPGGQKALKEYITKNVKFKSETQGGTILISFVVDEKGKVTEAKVARGISKDLDNEALRVVKSMPKWIPAEQNGEKVKSQVVVPVDIQPQW